MPDSSRVDAERVLSGRYHLRRHIAQGGMAEVWEAVDTILDRPVAVKVLRAELAADATFLERFRREAIAAARLAHPNIVATFDTGMDEGVAYIVMELVKAPTLRDLLAGRTSLTPARAVRIAAQVAGALDYAHKAGVVHRDIKPGNILVTADDRVKVADFGIAKAALPERAEAGPGLRGPDLTASGAILGTARYLSPEQVNGEAVDGRSDVYALGVVLYEMLCGRTPFTGETDLTVALQHVSETPLPPRQVKAGIPRPVETIVLRALAKRPAERFATAGDMQSALLSIDLRADDAVPLVVRDATPPGGVPAATFRQSERSWIYPVAIILVVAVALGLIGLVFASTDTGRDLLHPDEANNPAERTLAISTTQSFDPQGSRNEHDGELPNLKDGDPRTAWTTESYYDSNFGRLKEGVGVVAVLSGPEALDTLELSSPTRGWSARVYVADAPKPDIGSWGEPVATKSSIDGDTTFDLHGREGAAVLVWITDLGPGNQVAIGELRVTG
ncbi:MAG: protein kinase domain-containing protein [Acidimicrobiales bacterium]